MDFSLSCTHNECDVTDATALPRVLRSGCRLANPASPAHTREIEGAALQRTTKKDICRTFLLGEPRHTNAWTPLCGDRFNLRTTSGFFGAAMSEDTPVVAAPLSHHKHLSAKGEVIYSKVCSNAREIHSKQEGASMRIVAVADTHTYQADLGEIPFGDVFLHAGDLLQAGTLDEWAFVAAWLSDLPHRYKVIIAGNHDRCFAEHREQALAMLDPSVIYLEDSGVILDGLRFWGSPWQPAYNDWAFNLPRGSALADKWALIPSHTDILISHGPPQGIGDRGPTDGRAGCADLRAAVRRTSPKVHLFGHIHQDGGLWSEESTIFLNVTTWESERPPTVFDIQPHPFRLHPVQIPHPHARESYEIRPSCVRKM